MTHPKIDVTIEWAPRVQRFADVSAQIGGYLELLRSIDAEFSAWHIYGLYGDYSSGLRTWTDIAPLWNVDEKPGGEQRDDLNDATADGKVGDRTWSHDGFSLYLVTAAPGAPENAELRDQAISLSLRAGAAHSNGVELHFSADRGSPADYLFTRQLIEKSAAYWHAETASASISTLPVSWLTYLRSPLLAQCLRPTGACRTDLLEDGGILFSLVDHVPAEGAADDVAHARAAQAWIGSFHFKHECTVFGWPYDPADEMYAHQITGAPAGATYAVGFAAFDGYDAERKVLLFTKLFRRLPGAWNVRLSPDLAADPARLERIAYVVQARQHIAAVRYVGADNPIEWHVGIEDTAKALKTLLNDWAGIPEQQLRIVYTPFEGELPPLN